MIPLGTSYIPLPFRDFEVSNTGPGASTETRIGSTSGVPGVPPTKEPSYVATIDGRAESAISSVI